MRVQYLLCACLLLCGCTKVSDLTHQKSKSTEKAPVTVKKANKIKVVLTSVLPAAGFRWNKNITDAPERIELLNKRIKSYAKENRIPYVDYYSSMVSGSDRALNPEFTNDGVHPQKAGYTVMESLINPVIKRYLK